MVKGELIRRVIDFVAKKRGVDGINRLMELSNRRSILFTKVSDIKQDENYEPRYFIRVLSAAITVLGRDEVVREMGRYFAQMDDITFRGLTGRYPPKTSVQYMVIYARRNLPVFHTGYRTISENRYWIKISGLKKKYYPFIDGFFTYMFEMHGGVVDVENRYGEDYIKYVLKF